MKQRLYRFMNTRFGWGLIAVFPTVFTDFVEILFKFFTLGYYSPGITFMWMSKITLFKLRLNEQDRTSTQSSTSN